MKNYYFVVFLFLLFSSCKKEPLNVLMIAVDDLRPELGCYGNTLIQSPNIDKLASDGVLFENSFCNIPVCGASRASLLTGLRPTKNRFLSYYTQSDVEAPEAVCLPQHFKNNGYYTVSNGKVFHHFEDRAESWDENWRPETSGGSWRDYLNQENIRNQKESKRGAPYEIADVEDDAYHDGKLAEKTIADLKRLKEKGEPFFLASGFVKPHLPFNAPKKYWDLYREDDFAPSQKRYWPENAPREAFHNSGELRGYGDIPSVGFVDDTMSVKLQHGYYACVSYIDAQIGRVLEALEELELDKNTVVILWGDHGWNLGEHGLWCKHCNFNTSLQTPMIIKAPGKSQGASSAMTEYVDIFPTLCDLCDIDIPDLAEGTSLVPLLKDPDIEWKDYVICKYFNGLSIRTKEHLYTEWSDKNDKVISKMLYNHTIDPNETNNIVELPENEALVKELSTKMHANKGRDYFKKNEKSKNGYH